MTEFYQQITEEDFCFFVVLELKFGLDLVEEEANQKYRNWKDFYRNRDAIVEQLSFALLQQKYSKNKN